MIKAISSAWFYAKRKQFRRLFVVIYAVLVISTHAFAATQGGRITWIFFALMATIYITLLISTKSITETGGKKLERLDERQLTLRANAFTLAYGFVPILSVILLVDAIDTLIPFKLYPEYTLQAPEIIWFVFTLMTLPTLAFAWLEPDPIAD